MVSELDSESHELEDLVYDGLSELDGEPDLFSYSRPLTPEPPNCEWHYQSQPMDPEPPEDEGGDDVDELIREDREIEEAEQRSYAEYRQRPSFYWGTFWEDLQHRLEYHNSTVIRYHM